MKDNKLIAEFMGIEEAYNPNGNDWVLKTTTPDVNGDTDILESYKGNVAKMIDCALILAKRTQNNK
jgi:hypothetical protein